MQVQSIAQEIPPMDTIVQDLTWWIEFDSEAHARGDGNRIKTMKAAAQSLKDAGYSPNAAVHTLF